MAAVATARRPAARGRRTAAGYSGTPLAAKLGIKAGSTVHLAGAPDHFATMLEPLPPGVRFVPRLSAAVDLVHLFTTRASELRAALKACRHALAPTAVVWVSWPKRASGVASEVTEDTVREPGPVRAMGFGLLPKSPIAALRRLAGFATRLRLRALRWAFSAVQRVRAHSVNRPQPLGFVDVKVCAVDEVWSGLKLVVRRALR